MAWVLPTVDMPTVGTTKRVVIFTLQHTRLVEMREVKKIEDGVLIVTIDV